MNPDCQIQALQKPESVDSQALLRGKKHLSAALGRSWRGVLKFMVATLGSVRQEYCKSVELGNGSQGLRNEARRRRPEYDRAYAR